MNDSCGRDPRGWASGTRSYRGKHRVRRNWPPGGRVFLEKWGVGWPFRARIRIRNGRPTARLLTGWRPKSYNRATLIIPPTGSPMDDDTTNVARYLQAARGCSREALGRALE